jgi:hypothetical protein
MMIRSFTALLALAALDAAGAVAQTPTPVQVGDRIAGTLAEGDAVLEADGTYYDLYRVNVLAGQRIQVLLQSEDFDAFLVLGIEGAGDFSDDLSDDDSGGGTDARIRFVAEESGAYVIRANSLTGGEVGSYTLSVSELPPLPPPPAPTPVALGRTVTGALTDSDPLAEDDSHYDSYSVRVRAGETIVVEMRSDEFDTFLVVGRMEGNDFEVLDSDDDGVPEDGSTNSRLEITAEEAGTLIIRANSLAPGATGGYTLRVDAGA